MDAIPYTVEQRKDTGLYNAKLGIWLFLASEVMLFGALFSTYVLLRVGGAHWPLGSSILNVPIGAFNTAVLIASSVTMVMSWVALKEKSFKRFRLFLGLTILLALTFLVVKGFEYNAKFAHHFFPEKSTFLAIYFTLTGLHAAHVTVGAIMLTIILIRCLKGHFLPEHHFAFEAAAWYWHFVDVVWLFLFTFVYWL